MSNEPIKKSVSDKIFDFFAKCYQFMQRTTEKQEEDSLPVLFFKIVLQGVFVLLCIILSPFAILGFIIAIMTVL